MSKVTVVGAGNVGATCADVLAYREVAEEIVLIDIKEGIAEGKALDIWQKAPINQYDSRTVGSTNDYSKTANSDVVVITSGLPRKPGMSRDDLIATNAAIVKSVTENVVKHSPEAIIIVVSNPLDVMTYASYLAAHKPSNQVFGMAGVLDTARFKSFIATELNISPKEISAILMGGHGDTMVPLPRYTTISGIPLTELMPTELPVREGVSIIAAFVVPRDPDEPDGMDAVPLLAFAHEHLAAYKCPREIIFTDSLPRTANGKVRRRDLARCRQ